jgi:CheY-like chemotaxis protein
MQARRSRLRVLLVDDHEDARELVSMVLREAGAKAVTAASASDAMESLKGTKTDVLISDIGMPGEDGFMLINRVRSLAPEEGGAVPAIALTAYATEDDRQRALAAGYDNHVSKPVEPDELIDAVAQAAASFK